MLELTSRAQFIGWARAGQKTGGPLPPACLQSLDLTDYEQALLSLNAPGSIFLGCTMGRKETLHLISSGAVIMPNRDEFPFPTHRSSLYTPEQLFAGFDPSDPHGYRSSYDARVYRDYIKRGKITPPIDVSLHRGLHDHSITEAKHAFIAGRKVIAMMGGHSMERGSGDYAQVAKLSRILTRRGFTMASGGGPGAMEATHLGAWFASRDEAEMMEALAALSIRPEGAPAGKEYLDADWLHRAWALRRSYPHRSTDEAKACASLGIPTWFYGHEPPAPFATHIAKYFSNSLREDGLLLIATHGVLFAPGSAGTTQEIFQDAAQNHYHVTGYAAPMILMGVDYWQGKNGGRPVWPLLKAVSKDEPYGALVALSDDPREILSLIEAYNPEDHKVDKII